MNCIQKMLAAALGCVLSALLLTGCGEKEEPVNITLANHSGHGITSISITPSTSDEWDTELVDGIFQSGEMMEVSLVPTSRLSFRTSTFLSTTKKATSCTTTMLTKWILQSTMATMLYSCLRTATTASWSAHRRNMTICTPAMARTPDRLHGRRAWADWRYVRLLRLLEA